MKLGKSVPVALAALLLLPMASAQSLGDVARQLRKNKPAEPEKVWTNDDIPKWTNQVTWKSSTTQVAAAEPAKPADTPVEVKHEDVACSFYFNAQSLLPGKTQETPGTALPASELAKLDGTASIWGDTFEVSIHNGTTWQLKEVTLQLVTSAQPSQTSELHSRAAEHAAIADPPGDVSQTLSLALSAAPYSATVTREKFGKAPAADVSWSWQIVGAMGVPPAKTSAKTDSAADAAGPVAASASPKN